MSPIRRTMSAMAAAASALPVCTFSIVPAISRVARTVRSASSFTSLATTQVHAALGVAAPLYRLDTVKRDRIIAEVRLGAKQISAALEPGAQ
jgi:hypothetical protein